MRGGDALSSKVPSKATELTLGGANVVGTPGGGGWEFVDCLFLPPIPQFAEKFQEVKEAARLAREKSQDGGELTSPALGLTAHQVSTPCRMRARRSTDIGESRCCAGSQDQTLTDDVKLDPWQGPWKRAVGAMGACHRLSKC